jgi:TolA-binding protein
VSVKDVDIVENFQKAQSTLISAFENKIVEIQYLREKVFTLQKLLSEAKIKQQEVLQEITTTQQRYKALQLKYEELQNQSQEKIRALTKENESLRVQLWSVQTETQAQTAPPTTKASPTKDTQEILKNIDIPDQDMIKMEPNSGITSESRGLMIDFFEPTTNNNNILSNKNVVRTQVEVKKDKITMNDDEVIFLANI